MRAFKRPLKLCKGSFSGFSGKTIKKEIKFFILFFMACSMLIQHYDLNIPNIINTVFLQYFLEVQLKAQLHF